MFIMCVCVCVCYQCVCYQCVCVLPVCVLPVCMCVLPVCVLPVCVCVLPVCVSAPCRSDMEDRMMEERTLERSQRAHAPLPPSSSSSSETHICFDLEKKRFSAEKEGEDEKEEKS